MDAKEATRVVREYFESVKKIKFLFDVRNVRYDTSEEMWIVECDVQNVFDEEPISYEIGVRDETGEIDYAIIAENIATIADIAVIAPVGLFKKEITF